MSTQTPSESTPEEVRKRLEELARVSKDLEANVKMQASAPNIVAAEQLRKRVKELTDQQTRMMNELVAFHPEKERQEQFFKLSRSIDEYQVQIKACKEIEELRQLEKDLLKAADDFVLAFQTIVAELMGGAPPSEPIFS